MSDGNVAVYALADELNVSVDFLKDMIRAGKVRMVGNRVAKDSADELRWQLAMNRHVVGDTGQE